MVNVALPAPATDVVPAEGAEPANWAVGEIAVAVMVGSTSGLTISMPEVDAMTLPLTPIEAVVNANACAQQARAQVAVTIRIGVRFIGPT
jgi:hypothetical protein